MKVKDFIEWLKYQDQEAEVLVVASRQRCGHNFLDFEYFACFEHSNYIDFRGNEFVKENDSRYNKRFLEIGSV